MGILALLAVSGTAAVVTFIMERRAPRVPEPPQAPAVSVNVPAGSFVKIRHASDGLEKAVQVEVYDGPLSDVGVESVWDRLRGGTLSEEERREVIGVLTGQGFTVTVDGEVHSPGTQPESPVQEEPVPLMQVAGPMSACSMEELRALIIRGLKEHVCTPAFARLASEVYGFSLDFEDADMQRRSLDEGERGEAEAYREQMRADLAEAMRRYGEDHPEPEEPAAPPQAERTPVRLPEYDFSRMRGQKGL